MAICIIDNHGEPLMPTTRYGIIRHLLKDGKAIIVCRNPFTVQLLYDATSYTQPVEICVDSGYEHVGVSIKTEDKELFSEQYDLLPNEKKRHDDQRRYRRTRRSRKRHRTPRFNNRKHKQKFPPSIQHKLDAQIQIIRKYAVAMPITSITVEIGQFDPAVLKAIEEGIPVPSGVDYQLGERYGIATLREAVFQRDRYTCCFCGRSIKDGAILHAHHALYWKGRHADRVAELATCCERCHTTANHQEGALLWGYKPKIARLEGAAFMNTVRWELVNVFKAEYGDKVHFTYGAMTKLKRGDLGIEKSHVNDAYAMGDFHSKQRAEFKHYTKKRRNNRILEKFYDAQYIDQRDSKKKAGKDLGCERTNRREPRNSDKSLRCFRGIKLSKGRRNVRRTRYSVQPGTIFLLKGKRYSVEGCCHYGEQVKYDKSKYVNVKNIKILKYASGWMQQKKGESLHPHS